MSIKWFARPAIALATGLFILAGADAAAAQNLYGVNPFSNTGGSSSSGLFYLDNTTGAIIDGRVITVPSRTITGAQGLTRDPTTGVIYAIARASGVTGRLLITIDLATGSGVEVGNLGDNFASITFRSDGQLFGVTGDGATVPETLYLINKATAAKTLATTLGNGSDGEVIAYNSSDGFIYHWSGSSSNPVFERIQSVSPYTVTNIPISGSATAEVFGAVWNPAISQFQVHDIGSVMSYWTTSGVRGNNQPATLADVRGLALVPNIAPVPTMTEWAMILLTMALAGTAALVIQRRHGNS